MILYALVVLLIALLPVAMFLKNATEFLPACSEQELLKQASSQRVSILIPARNEESSIGPSLETILSNRHPSFEVLVLDDQSEDQTASQVQSFATRDSRVRLLTSNALPPGWNGKQHACWQLANQSQYEWLLFLDADVRLAEDAVVRCVAEQIRSQSPLISGFPMQETGTMAEKILIPLMHYVLLGYLPIDRMRSSLGVGLAAGCGQLFFADKQIYMSIGGHSAIRNSRHDGIQLPRTFRRAGYRSDIFDATDIARCRMYTSTKEVCNGLLKNATEGIANARLILPFSILLIGGSVLPGLSFVLGYLAGASSIAQAILFLALAISLIPRLLACMRFQQSYVGAVLHPLGVACFVAIQWVAILRKQLGLTTKWRGRT
ncbi:MAG TPA: glycosyltransferase [Pirellula sp.]|nr:glycosyltransferase [Pirellula sp.]